MNTIIVLILHNLRYVITQSNGHENLVGDVISWDGGGILVPPVGLRSNA